jgi:hypothetical protein
MTAERHVPKHFINTEKQYEVTFVTHDITGHFLATKITAVIEVGKELHLDA